MTERVLAAGLVFAVGVVEEALALDPDGEFDVVSLDLREDGEEEALDLEEEGPLLSLAV
jgi:hypothetical protein